jgi:hypothetical protein
MKKLVGCIFLCSFITGCAFYHQAKPIDPGSGLPLHTTMVYNLGPTLTWEPKFDGPYDIIIYEVSVKATIENKLIQHAENLNGNSFKIQKTLELNKVYGWHVRKHSESNNEPWSSYNYFAYYGVAWVYYRNLPFTFCTPVLEEQVSKTKETQ